MAGRCTTCGGWKSQRVEDEEESSEEELSEEEEDWVDVLLRTRFWEPCSRGHREENLARAENCLFCIKCYQVFCPHCRHDVPGHHLLKIRRYVYRSIVYVKDMQELNVDVSRIQQYVINSHKGVHLRPMRRSVLYRPQPGAPCCETCYCWLRHQPNAFCSLTCKRKANVSQDDFSGPEAERRYRSIQPHMLQPQEEQLVLEEQVDEQHQPSAEAEVPPAPREPEPKSKQAEASTSVQGAAGQKKGHISFRRRPRKQKDPQRAPFQ